MVSKELEYSYDIYIPIWFYSNRKWTNEDDAHLAIYIPIWFYSNDVQGLFDAMSIAFTFQSGSILIQAAAGIFLRNVLIYIPIWFYSNADSESS